MKNSIITTQPKAPSYFGLLVLLLFLAFPNTTIAQISTYTFTQAPGVYAPIGGGTLVSSPTGGDDDDAYTPSQPIGFPFVFAGTAYTTVTIHPDGYVHFVAGQPNTNRINAFNRDLVQRALPSNIRIQTIGVSPNQVCVIQYTNWGRFNNANDVYNFQIRLSQTTNTVSVVYGAITATFIDQKRVGVIGATIDDFNNRVVDENNNNSWAFSNPANNNGFRANTSPLFFPASGLTYSWRPLVQPVYCIPVYPAPSAVNLDTLSFFTNLGSQIPLGNMTNMPSYTNILTNSPPSVVSGQTIPFEITLPANNPFMIPINPRPGNGSVWIDFNRNEVFEATEWSQVFTNSKNGGGVNILVPVTAPLGLTRVRARTALASSTLGPNDACTAFNSGSTRDYTINIIAPNCSAAPAPTSVVSSASAACPGVPFSLSLATTYTNNGLIYKWQSAPSIDGPYTNIPGSISSPTYTGTQTVATAYRCIISCAGLELSTVATPINIPMKPSSACSNYCEASVSTAADSDIGNISFGSLNNGTATPVLSNMAATGTYTDNTALAPPNLARGASVPLSLSQISSSSVFADAIFAAYIDYNQNGSFADAGERVFASSTLTSLAAPTQTGNVIIPLTATLGNTRMRVVLVEAFDVLPSAPACNPMPSSFGEVEDYTVNIVPVPCPAVVVSPASGAFSFTNGTAIPNIVLAASGGNNPGASYVYTISSGDLPAGLVLANGIISGTPTSAGSGSFTVRASADNCSGTATYSFTVLPPPCTPVVVSPAGRTFNLINGRVIPNIVLNASGGSLGASYTYSVTAGALPAGITLTNGVLSGIPTSTGSGSFTLTATSNPGNCVGSVVYSFTVAPPPCSPITITPMPVPLSLTTGTAIANIILGASGGTAGAGYTYSITAGALPTGVVLTNGIISGTPTGVGTGSFTVTATSNPGNCVGNAVYNFTIACLPLIITPAAAPLSFTRSTAITNIVLGASGGPSGAVYTYAVTAGALPAGLTLANGIISGIPTTAGSGSFTVLAVSNPGNCIGSAVYTFTVAQIPCTPVVISPTPVPLNLISGIAIAPITLSASGGNPGATYTYAITAGVLPPGVELGTFEGIISGTPIGSFSGSFTVSATSNPGNCVGSVVYNYTVVGPPCPSISLTPAPLTSFAFIAGAAAPSITFSVSGGVLPAFRYTYSVTAGALPDGLTLTNRTISGIPNSAGSGSFTIRAIDSVTFCSVSGTYNYTVSPPACTPVTVLPTAAPASAPLTFTNGTAITNIVLGASGGSTGASYAYSVSAGTLPAGLMLTNGIISGTPSGVGSGSFTIRATSNPGNCVGTAVYNFVVNGTQVCPILPTLVLTPAALPLDTLVKATVGQAYNQTFAATGIVGASYTYSTSGVLPAGLTFIRTASSVTISGTPTTTGTTTVVVRATSNLGCQSVARNFILVVRQSTSANTALSNSLKVYPNPFNNEFTVDLTGIDIGGASLNVYNAVGKKVFESKIKTNRMAISLDKMAVGMYLIEIQTGQGRVVKKLVKK